MGCKFSWQPQFESKTTDMNFSNIFYLTQYVQSIINPTCNQYKKLLRYFTLLSFHTKSCVYFTGQHILATFQGLINTWLEATIWGYALVILKLKAEPTKPPVSWFQKTGMIIIITKSSWAFTLRHKTAKFYHYMCRGPCTRHPPATRGVYYPSRSNKPENCPELVPPPVPDHRPVVLPPAGRQPAQVLGSPPS